MSEHVNFQPLCTTYGQRKNRLQNENDEVGKMALILNFKTMSVLYKNVCLKKIYRVLQLDSSLV